MTARKNVCLYCASSSSIPQVYKDASAEVARLCAKRGLCILNGAGSAGIMGITTDAALAEGGRVIGIIPQFMVDYGWCHSQLSETIVTSDMASRKQRFRDLSDGVIVLPGGCGTMEEFFETYTSRQLGLYNHPIIVLNTNGFYDCLKVWFQRCLEEHFVHEEMRGMVVFADTPEEAVDLFFTLPDRTGTISNRSK